MRRMSKEQVCPNGRTVLVLAYSLRMTQVARTGGSSRFPTWDSRVISKADEESDRTLSSMMGIDWRSLADL